MSELRYRLRLAATPSDVFALLSTAQGRARFWAEAAPDGSDGDGGSVIDFHFPDGSRLRSRVLELDPGERIAIEYFGGSRVEFALEPGEGGGTELTLTESGLSAADREENAAGWVSVLLALKAAADFGVDLRNHDSRRTWREGYVEN